MTKARDLANASTALSAVSATELAFVDGVTSAIQTQLDAKTAKSTLTTTGDIYYASAANTPARLGIGSTDQILKVTGGVPVWATPASGGSMTLLSTTTMSGATTTVSSISQSYKHLYIEINSLNVSAFNPTINYLTNGSAVVVYLQQSASSDGVGHYSTAGTLGDGQNYASGYTNNKANWTIFDYTDAVNGKPHFFNQHWVNEGGANIYVQGGMYSTHTAALTSISLTVSTGTFTAGTIKIYGVN